MSITNLPIYNSKSFGNGSKYLSVDDANRLYYQKASRDLIIQGDEYVQNETVYGAVTANTITCTGGLTAGNAYNTAHTINGNMDMPNRLTVGTTLQVSNTVTMSASNIVFGKIPITNTDITANITDDKHFITKKYMDNRITNMFEAGLNQWGGTNIFYDEITIDPTAGQINVTGCCNLSNTNGALFSVIPKTEVDLKSTITDDKQFITRGYLQSVVPSTAYSTKAIIGEQAYWRVLQGGGTTTYKLYPPIPQTDGYICYLNFPTTSGSNNLICHNALLNFDHYYQQNIAIAGFTSNGDGSYSTTTAITSEQMIFTQSLSTFLKEITSLFHITMSGPSFGVKAYNQSTAIWNSVSSTTNQTVSTTTFYAPPGTAKTINAIYDGGTFSAFPINFTRISASKLKIEIKFPSLHGVNTSSALPTANNPTKTGWTSNVHACIEVRSSMPSSLSSIPSSIVLSPSTTMNTETGGAYLTLT